MSKNSPQRITGRLWTLFGTLILLVIVFGWMLFSPGPSDGRYDAFAQCLKDRGIVMYGAAWCPHCQNEKRQFGTSFRLVPYVECPQEPQKCLAQGIQGYPAWKFPDGRKFEGEQGLERLAQESGCPLSVAAKDK